MRGPSFLTDIPRSAAAAKSGLDFCRKGRIGVVKGASVCPVPVFLGSPRGTRGFGWWERRSGASVTQEPNMPSVETVSSAQAPKAVSRNKAAKAKPAAKQPPAAAPTSSKATVGDGSQTARVTKHDRVLTLLTRREGATIPEMMEATAWQQHSVRGFLAGTVKKKLGFTLTSKKIDGELRRYRIETKRGR